MGSPGLDAIDLSDDALSRDGFPHDVFTTLRREAPVRKYPDTEILRPMWATPGVLVTVCCSLDRLPVRLR